MVKIAVVNSSSFGNVFPEHLEELRKFAEVERIKVPLDIGVEEFSKKLMPYDGIIASVNPDYPSELLKNLSNLKIIARHGIGYNNVDVEAATEFGIILTKVAGPIERNSVAEQAVALMLSAARHIPQGNTVVREGQWKKRANFVGIELSNKKIGVIGIGNIGSRAAEILKNGFNAEILAYDPMISSEDIKKQGYKAASFEELLKEADAITLHCALSDDSYHLLSEKEFALMKEGVIIVNTARGELVDDQAIIPFLKTRHIKAYAADVVEGEPIDEEHSLLQCENAIVVPHLGGYSYESLCGMGLTMLNNMKAVFVENRVPEEDLVNKNIKDNRL